MSSIITTSFLLIKRFFSFVLIQKKQKINPKYIYPKNHRTNFPIATPAARVSHSTRGSLPSANAEIHTVIFWYKYIREIIGSTFIAILSMKEIFTFLAHLIFIISGVR
jgi:hypothetical protein